MVLGAHWAPCACCTLSKHCVCPCPLQQRIMSGTSLSSSAGPGRSDPTDTATAALLRRLDELRAENTQLAEKVRVLQAAALAAPKCEQVSAEWHSSTSTWTQCVNQHTLPHLHPLWLDAFPIQAATSTPSTAAAAAASPAASTSTATTAAAKQPAVGVPDNTTIIPIDLLGIVGFDRLMTGAAQCSCGQE